MKSLVEKYYKKYKEPIMYLIFGALTTAVNYVSYFILAHHAKLPVSASNIAAWIISVLFAFFTNKLWVFESKSMRADILIKELLTFTGCRVLSGMLDTGIMVLFVDWLKYNDLIMKIVSNVFVVIINYVFSKTIIFTKKGRAVNG